MSFKNGIRGLKKNPAWLAFCLIWALLFLLGIVFLGKAKYIEAAGCLLWGGISVYLFFVCANGAAVGLPAYTGDRKADKRTDLLLAVICVLLVLACTLPMGAAPAYNGEFAQHRNQYELLARSFREGHLYFDYDDVDPLLSQMANPYDPAERTALGVTVYTDHTYYQGRYYMYFGVVPVWILFLPYLLITGRDLTTYHATQIFAALAIIGVFLLFRQLAKRYFGRMSRILLFSLSVAFSFICVYFSIGTPALYCTATTSAVCMEVWSLYFFTRSIFLTEPQQVRRRVGSAMLGSLFGALTFGCRPTAALGNLLLIPLCARFVREERSAGTPTRKIAGKVLLIALPYLLVAAALMAYNYARFGNPFEFGQTYQMTGADLSSSGNLLQSFSTVRTVNGLFTTFFGFTPIVGTFPFVYYSSVFVNFPVLLAVFGLFREKVWERAGERKLRFFMLTLLAAPVLITGLTMSTWNPAERYRMDIYYLLVLLAFLVIGFMREELEGKKAGHFEAAICVLCLAAVFFGVLFLLYPDDYNYTDWFPESLETFRRLILLR